MQERTRAHLTRSRWAAVGAAVAVTLGAGGIAFVDAAKDSGDRPVTVTLDEPCRLRDTRADKGVGGRTAPIGPGEAYTVQGTGASGNCNVPGDAVGLVTNVTAVNATQDTNLRLYPTGGTVPTVSHLNPRPGAPPTPNGVTVGLDGSGQFDIRNAKGNVDVIIDVVAYLVHHTHDDRYVLTSQATRVHFARVAINGDVQKTGKQPITIAKGGVGQYTATLPEPAANCAVQTSLYFEAPLVGVILIGLSYSNEAFAFAYHNTDGDDNEVEVRVYVQDGADADNFGAPADLPFTITAYCTNPLIAIQPLP